MAKYGYTVRYNWGETYSATVYTFNIEYLFNGSMQLFRLRPSTYVMTSFPIYLDDSAKIVFFPVKLSRMDPVEFQQAKDNNYRRAFANLNNVNKDAARWNGRVASEVRRIFAAIKGKYLTENSFFEAINVRVNPSTQSVFSAPTITKKAAPQPPKANTKQFSQEPTMSKVEWVDQIIKTVERSRNVIMHSGELVNQDIERIGSCIRDWINQVG